jgi:DNA-binding MurR/RpiR family transcriptional regulator
MTATLPAPSAPDILSARIKTRTPALSPRQRLVASFIDSNAAEAGSMTALEIAGRTGVSDASVIRTCYALGFDGLTGLRQAITEARGERATHAGTLRQALSSVDQDIEGAIDLVLGHEARLVANLERDPARKTMMRAVARLHAGKRIVLFGTGASGHLAAYASTMLARHGRQTLLLCSSGFSLADEMLSLRAGDVLLMLCYGRPYAEAEAVVETARKLGIGIVMITENRHNLLIAREDLAIEVRRVGTAGSPLHGASFICIEALIMGLAAIDDQAATGTLERLAEYRQLITRRRRPG